MYKEKFTLKYFTSNNLIYSICTKKSLQLHRPATDPAFNLIYFIIHPYCYICNLGLVQPHITIYYNAYTKSPTVNNHDVVIYMV